MKYLSIPFSHSNPSVVQERMTMFWKALAHRITISKEVVVSPMTLYPMLDYVPHIPTNYDYWGPYSESLLSQCDTLYVLMLEGWKESKGVQGEIDFAMNHKIQIIYLSPLTFEPISIKNSD